MLALLGFQGILILRCDRHLSHASLCYAIQHGTHADACVSSNAGLGQPTTGLTVKRNAHTLKLTFNDPNRVIARSSDAMLQLTGHAKDAPTGLNVCFTADVHVC